jgi:uncharacterized protein YegL
MKKNLTELVFIIDKSGSMSGLEGDTIGGFNSMLKKQRAEEGEAYLSTVLFDTEEQVLYDRVPIEKVPEMTAKDYVPGGCTALLDAVGGAIRHIGNIHKYARPEDVPEHTVFVITTDGQENASRHFTQREVKAMIERQREKYGWEFIFLAANIDAVKAASSIGISRKRSASFRPTDEGVEACYAMASAAISRSRRLEDFWLEDLEDPEESGEKNAKKAKK